MDGWRGKHPASGLSLKPLRYWNQHLTPAGFRQVAKWAESEALPVKAKTSAVPSPPV